MKSEEVELIFLNLGDVNKVEFFCFADASLGNLSLGENKRYAPIAWQSMKIPPVVKSSPAAGTLALQEGSEHCYALKAFFPELVGQHDFPIGIYTDSKSRAECVLSTNTLRNKRLNMDVAGLHEMLEKRRN